MEGHHPTFEVIAPDTQSYGELEQYFYDTVE
jgi:hypothetical protein